MIRFTSFPDLLNPPLVRTKKSVPTLFSGLARIHDCIMTVVTGYDIYRVNVMTDMDPDTHVYCVTDIDRELEFTDIIGM